MALSLQRALNEITRGDEVATARMMRVVHGGVYCGICEKHGSDIYWYSPLSDSAHSRCFEQIRSAETDCLRQIQESFQETVDQNLAHMAAIKAVKAKVGPHFTISSYCKQEGADKLKALFDTVGLKAALSFTRRARL